MNGPTKWSGGRLSLAVAIALYIGIGFPAAGQETQEERANRKVAEERAKREQRLKVRDAQEEEVKNQMYHVRLDVETRNAVLLSFKRSSFRNPTFQELQAVAVPSDELAMFNSLHLGNNSGVFVLLPSKDCGQSSNPSGLSDWCSIFSMPGNGSSYSFRASKYRMARYADLSMEDGLLKAGSRKTLGFLVDLGEKEIAKVAETTRGMQYIFTYVPPGKPDGVEPEWNAFDQGRIIEGFKYSRRLPIQIGHVYALRTIAFRAVSQQESWGYVFNELDFDKRRDLVVVFQIVSQTTDGKLTIIWRVLRDIKSPDHK